MSSVRNRFGPGTMLARPNSGTSSGDSSESESMLTRIGSNGTRSQTRYPPEESLRAPTDPTSTCTLARPGTPTSRRPFALSARKTRPDKPERSSDGPGATPTRPAWRSHTTDPCTNWLPVTGAPGVAATAVTARTAGRYDVSDRV